MTWRCGIRLILFAFLVGLLSAVCATRCNSCPQNGCNQYRVDNGVCRRGYYTTYSYRVSYWYTVLRYTQYTTTCGWWRRCTHLRFRAIAVIRYRSVTGYQYHCAEQCCSGWHTASSYPLTCKPPCSGGCQNGGTCIDINKCSCTIEWTGSNCEDKNANCTCYNGGTCVYPNECACTSSWTGTRCETPICSGGCLNGGLCVKPDTCSCPSGWTGASCETDIDECSNNTSECNHYCNNTDGWYFCTCQDGFMLGTDKHNCTDVDECNSTDNGGCDHICSNTPGSYNCSCNEGFTMMGENNTCTEEQASRAEEPLLGTPGVAAVSGGAVFVIITALVLCVVVALAVKLRGTFCRKEVKDKTQDTEPPPEEYGGFELTPNPAYGEVSYVKSDRSQNGGVHPVNDDDGVGNVYVSTDREPPAYENLEMLY